MVRANDLRYRIDPGDISPEKAARRLGLTLAQFEQEKPALLGRGFPAPDVTTGNYCLEAIDAWRLARHPHLFPGAQVDAPNLGPPLTMPELRANLRSMSDRYIEHHEQKMRRKKKVANAGTAHDKAGG